LYHFNENFMTTLHILRKRNDQLAEAAIRSESDSGKKGDGLSILLIQDAVLGRPDVSAPIFINAKDLKARGVVKKSSGSELIDYDRISQMIVEHDRTVVW